MKNQPKKFGAQAQNVLHENMQKVKNMNFRFSTFDYYTQTSFTSKKMSLGVKYDKNCKK